MAGDAMMPVEVNDRWSLWVTYHRSARWLAAQHQQIGYERQRLQSMNLHIRPTDTIFDIGAEQGDITALLASWIPDGKMVAVEPCAASWPSIRKTFEANNLARPACVTAFCGAGDQIADQPSYWGSEWPAAAYGEMVPDSGFATYTDDSPMVRVDSLTETFGPPDVITIDVEGFEHDVLLGAQKTLQTHHPHVFVSMHPQFTAGTRRQPSAAYNMLDQYGYRLWHLGADHEVHIHAEPREGRS